MSTEDKVVKAKSNVQLVKDSLPSSMSYAQYRDLVAKLALEKKTTGILQTEDLVDYTQLNDRRMKRWDKTLKFSDEATTKIKSVDQKITWLVLTESWCGDASPAIPVMHKITELNPNISLSIIIRDEHLDIMNQFLTNGAMSIPKLISMNASENRIIAMWGPRSTRAILMVEAYKQEHGQLTPEFKQDLQVFYNKDKGQSIVEDLLRLLPLK
ncbi:thioredoxin family protein [Maribacter sp. ACAM166]|uniref:thioredoxin family protein n=1 Tax=Maribacter sp. ACAM166 TaxID=2508996 RepID=UPI0010FECF3C|nr:thioredoxin family protein [Maribacter sp. ACAM166]TLP82624.1 thioredoxin family protein [Maribacter sp. ACAM166]